MMWTLMPRNYWLFFSWWTVLNDLIREQLVDIVDYASVMWVCDVIHRAIYSPQITLSSLFTEIQNLIALHLCFPLKNKEEKEHNMKKG